MSLWPHDHGALSAPPNSEQFGFTLDALEATAADVGPIDAGVVSRLAQRVLDGLGHQYRARPRYPGDPACDVDWAAEPIARSADRHPRGDSGPESGEGVVGVHHLDQLEDGVQQRAGWGAHQHPRIADRLENPPRRSGQAAGQIREPARELPQLF